MNQDTFKVTVLPDGSVKVETDKIGDVNHMSADGFIKWMAMQLGGETTSQPVHHGHTHSGAGHVTH